MKHSSNPLENLGLRDINAGHGRDSWMEHRYKRTLDDSIAVDRSAPGTGARRNGRPTR